jgi:hypothetical protein
VATVKAALPLLLKAGSPVASSVRCQ